MGDQILWKPQGHKMIKKDTIYTISEAEIFTVRCNAVGDGAAVKNSA